MKTDKYLYGDMEIDPVPMEVIDQRVEALTANRKRLLEVDIETRDFVRIKAIQDAISFWIELGRS